MEKLTANLDFDGVDPELAWHLLDLHWNRQHHAFMVTYRPAFMRDMASGGPYFSCLWVKCVLVLMVASWHTHSMITVVFGSSCMIWLQVKKISYSGMACAISNRKLI